MFVEFDVDLHKNRWGTVYVKCNVKKVAIRIYGSETSDFLLCGFDNSSISDSDVSFTPERIRGSVQKERPDPIPTKRNEFAESDS
ncbi:hypothetical protein AVEN_56115-1 [Araneus ventricosus]|uniref:Uncharacterized protein n=1 Tax=Araneus ventricosus TaxID=182803 RepID=A0A4Y2GRQ4_ARAVE|nr:hypothetical protein AVEN_56115-1 [Araneus ventricosus]